MPSRRPDIDTLVLFHNSQGLPTRGTLMHLTRNLVVFEVYNPYSIVQLSEVLTEVKVLRGERVIYSGRAVVSNLVSTGLMLIVSATLVDPWSDLAGLMPGQGLREEVSAFVQEWNENYRLGAPFQLAVTNLRAFLDELSRWLQQAEVASSPTGPSNATTLSREFLDEVEKPLDPKLIDLFADFEVKTRAVSPEESHIHRAFAQHELHPLILCSPFIHRTFSKPLGYAGDYEMVNMIMREPWEGTNAYAQILNAFILRKDPAEAHRNRVAMLRERLGEELVRAENRGAPLRVLNVGCGPAWEVQRLIGEDPRVVRAEIHLLDFNAETIQYTRGKLEDAIRAYGRKPRLEFIHKSIHDLLKESARNRDSESQPYDMVYCAGLFDYLSERICRRLLELFHRWTVPGGVVLATNVHRNNPILGIMDYLLEWHLIYRDEKEMESLGRDLGTSRIWTDRTGINVYLELRKDGA